MEPSAYDAIPLHGPYQRVIDLCVPVGMMIRIVSATAVTAAKMIVLPQASGNGSSVTEATASVDPENEVHLQQAISALVKNKTLIVIAHRLSTIRDADQILVVDNGKIVEKGVHAELIQQKGIYQKFWNIRQKARNWKLAQ